MGSAGYKNIKQKTVPLINRVQDKSFDTALLLLTYLNPPISVAQTTSFIASRSTISPLVAPSDDKRTMLFVHATKPGQVFHLSPVTYF